MQDNFRRPGLAFALAAFFSLATLVPAQAPSRQPVPALSLRYGPSRDSGSASAALIIHVEIAPGWHINSDAPLDELLVPTSVEAKAEGVRFGKPRFPKPERVHSQVMGDMLLFSGAFDVEVPVLPKARSDGAGSRGANRAQAGLPDSPRTHVTLKYQACDQATCFAPKEISIDG